MLCCGSCSGLAFLICILLILFNLLPWEDWIDDDVTYTYNYTDVAYTYNNTG